jgi:hypothetical protein
VAEQPVSPALASLDSIGDSSATVGVDSRAWQVLLNYRHLDAAYCVGAMHDFLAERFGADRIFRDCRSLRPGEDYTKLILDIVRQCQALVVVIGPHWLDRDNGQQLIQHPKDWVRREIGLALRLRKHVLPVLLDGVEMSSLKALPKEIAELSSLTPQSVSHRRLREDFEALAERLAELVPTLGR